MNHGMGPHVFSYSSNSFLHMSSHINAVVSIKAGAILIVRLLSDVYKARIDCACTGFLRTEFIDHGLVFYAANNIIVIPFEAQ